MTRAEELFLDTLTASTAESFFGAMYMGGSATRHLALDMLADAIEEQPEIFLHIAAPFAQLCAEQPGLQTYFDKAIAAAR
jgi:hypothetical protein